MKRSTILIVFILFLINLNYGQIDHMKKKMNDVGAESQGLLTLRFTNAADGAPVSYATIRIQGMKSMVTDAEGKVMFDIKPDGLYPIKFEKKGYISEELTMEINRGKINNNRFVVSPDLQKDTYRIVLTWNEKPADLDAHFVKDEKYRISSKDIQKSPDSLVKLESDSELGYGPESFVVQNLDSISNATFVVKDYSNKKDKDALALSKSKALVKVYCAGKVEYAWKPSKHQKGNVWMVFILENGKIIPTTEVTNY